MCFSYLSRIAIEEHKKEKMEITILSRKYLLLHDFHAIQFMESAHKAKATGLLRQYLINLLPFYILTIL